MRALFVAARPLAASDLLLLRLVRETSPGTAIVVVTRTPTHPDLKRAFESGATAFLSWPASIDSLRQAIASGGLPLAPGARRLP
jgi:DNA-binding NarL/FixJ family response regulator